MNLSERAMLASLNIRQWSAKKHDKRITAEVAAQHHSDETMGRYNKTLVSKTALEKIQKIANQARQDFYRLTLPWADDGSRILTSAGYLKLAASTRKHEVLFEDASQEFFEGYDSYVADAKRQLNGIFNPADYPNHAELREKFGYSFQVRPFPAEEDFRVKLADAEVELIRRQIKGAVQGATQAAMRDVWGRMQSVVSHAAEKLKAYKVTKAGVEGVFRDSLVDNIRELLDVLPALNLTDDPAIVQFADEMRKLCKHDAMQLRENDGLRNQVAETADDILAKMSRII